MTGVVFLVLSIVVVAWLTAAATAVRTVSRIWLRHWVERQLRGAGTASLYLERPHRMLLSATTAVSLTVFVAGAFLATTVRGALAVPPSTIAYALVLLVLGQLVPRAIGRRWATTLIPVLLPPLRAAELLLSPLLRAARRISGAYVRDQAVEKVGEDDTLEELLREGELEGVSESAETAIISGVVRFGEKRIREVMTPRADVFALDADLAPDVLATQIAASGYSRVPLYRGRLDDVIGMAHVFDVLKQPDATVPRVRPVAVTRPDASCEELLSRMLRDRAHQAVVREESGNLAGIVTLEDLLEELVGEIRDEHDDPVPAPPGPSRHGDVAAGASTP